MKRSQEARIIDYLAAGHALTPVDALNRFGCFRLSARIHELRKQGHEIIESRVNRRGKTYSCYRLVNRKAA